MGEEHRKPKKFAIQGTTKVTGVVWPYFDEEGDIKWSGQVEFGQVTLVHILRAPTEVEARRMLVESLGKACEDIAALKDSIHANVQRL